MTEPTRAELEMWLDDCDRWDASDDLPDGKVNASEYETVVRRVRVLARRAIAAEERAFLAERLVGLKVLALETAEAALAEAHQYAQDAEHVRVHVEICGEQGSIYGGLIRDLPRVKGIWAEIVEAVEAALARIAQERGETVRGAIGMSNLRPSWPERMLAAAELWSRWSTCKRRQVGAVIFDPETFAILGIGYNDSARGEVNCGDGGCSPCTEGSVKNNALCSCVHAELNAVLLSRRDVRGMHMAIWNVKNGASVVGDLCVSCHKHLLQAGISAIAVGYRDEGGVIHMRYVDP